MASMETENKSTNGTATAYANGQTDTNGMSQDEQYRLPDAKTLQEVGELPIKDEDGKEVPFKTLYEDKAGRQLITFIRHFYCGHCEEFVRHLCKTLPPSTLSATNPPTTLTIVGCGEPICIPDYRIRTMSSLTSSSNPTDQKAYAIYTDRSLALYNQLGMLQNLQGSSDGKMPEYITTSLTTNVLGSLKNIVTAGGKGLRGGKYTQNGGEWLFEDGELKWCRRMRNTQDHATIAELKGLIGFE
ncbi:hypothetical protein LTR37_021387 [Vermiconidia calcicola]|uniref:Uncharacterized protein n=1 Tax=Vermiconidia calcicola TaxID=1690605 RepID=A0ACC3MAN0_9PEZI|nr:hypothetical protein LTR37_021387 [Vermiconidia calcicola]